MGRATCPACRRAVVVERAGEGAMVRGVGEPRRILAGRCPHPSCGAPVCAPWTGAPGGPEASPSLHDVDALFAWSPVEKARWLASFLTPSALLLLLVPIPISVFASAYTTQGIGAGRVVVMLAACVLASSLVGVLWLVWLGAREDLCEHRTARERALRGGDESLVLRPEPKTYRG